MPTNANTFNSRVTSEALEAKFRQVFPSQGGAELVQDLFASGVIQPVVDFSTVAEGSVLPQNLQTAWDFATGHNLVTSATPVNVITNPGFWLVDLNYVGVIAITAATPGDTNVHLWDGSTIKPVWQTNVRINASAVFNAVESEQFVVYLRAGDALRAKVRTATDDQLNIWYRQIADVNGTLVNPLGFTFS